MTTELKTRKPTGRPSWPILLLAGAEKAGKSYTAAVATSSPLIGRSYWVTIGEDEPDEYGQLGDFDIVQHDGTYQGILAAIRTVNAQPVPSEGVPLLVVDSMTRLWDLITNHAQDVANRRKKKGPGEDAQITMDLWNAARDQWVHVMDAIRDFPGPVILTARLELVAVMSDSGQPTTAKDWKVQAHKSLPYDAGAVIQMPARGETWITGVRSVKFKLDARRRAPKDFTVDWFWRELGLGVLETGPRDHRGPVVAGYRDSDQDPGIMKEPKARLRDPAVTGPVVDATGPADTRPRSSRTVENSGAGRTDGDLNRDKAPKTSEDDRHAIADEWATRAGKAITVTAARDLYRDANRRGILDYPLTTGELLGDVLRARGEHLADEEAHAAEAAEPLDIPTDDLPAELPF